jgi:O-acetyl-ADP-ribose deacetylase (regulator of RNase III)
MTEMSRFEVVLGDITKQKVDAIVNAANKSLLRGGGVDGAIHRSAGSELEVECLELEGCLIGQAKITKAYDLEDMGIGWVIHAIGPKWLGGSKEEEKLLESAYRRSLELAENYAEIYQEQCMSILEKHIEGLDESNKEKIRREVFEDVKSYVKEHPIKTIAFPSISTGIYHFPLEKATSIAINTIRNFLDKNISIEKVILVCFNSETYESYLNSL